MDLSAKESFFIAQYIPNGIDIRQIKNRDNTLSKIVAGNLSKILSLAGLESLKELPKSKTINLFNQSQY
jgi:hypothetical protein